MSITEILDGGIRGALIVDLLLVAAVLGSWLGRGGRPS